MAVKASLLSNIHSHKVGQMTTKAPLYIKHCNGSKKVLVLNKHLILINMLRLSFNSLKYRWTMLLKEMRGPSLELLW